MLGAIIGDMVGSVYEFSYPKTKDFNIFNEANKKTDDSILTLAVAKVLIKNYPINYSEQGLNKIKKELIEEFKKSVEQNPYVGWGAMFYDWATNYNHNDYKPYNSFGNGSAMRISSVGWIANSENEVKQLSKAVSEITHNHKEGIKGAEAVAMCIYLARIGKSKEYIKEYVFNHYYTEIKTLDFSNLVATNKFNATCQGSVPQSIYCFLISNSLEDCIRNCIAIGGDTDTIAAIAGSIAEAYYQRQSVSPFESKFIYLFIEHSDMCLIKDFFKIIGNKKYKK